LEGALAIGRQADPLGLDAVKVRFEAAQGQATRTTSVPDRHLLFKAKGWFESCPRRLANRLSDVPACCARVSESVGVLSSNQSHDRTRKGAGTQLLARANLPLFRL
jgi:hypothetical protein